MGVRSVQHTLDRPGIGPPGHREPPAVGSVEQVDQVAQGGQLDVLHLVQEQFASVSVSSGSASATAPNACRAVPLR